jgi:hypothetical protein
MLLPVLEKEKAALVLVAGLDGARVIETDGARVALALALAALEDGAVPANNATLTIPTRAA